MGKIQRPLQGFIVCSLILLLGSKYNPAYLHVNPQNAL